MTLPGGRYSCALALRARCLPFFAGYTLGQVCHIVQLAISQKKLLGYLRGAVVPYGRSQSMVKDKCAQRQSPEVESKSGLADWENVRTFLREILGTLKPGVDSIPLSNMKRLFRSRFHKELSETALGHSKLSELLQDPRLHDLASVQLQAQSYVVTSVARPPSCQVSANVTPIGQAGRSSLRDRAVWVTPLSLESASTSQTMALEAAAIATVPPPPTARPPYIEPIVGVPLPPSASTPCSGGTVLRKSVRIPELTFEMPETSTADAMSQDSTSQGRSRSEHSPASEKASMDTLAADTSGRPLLTPCTLASMGFTVSNTFIQVYAPPFTPMCGSVRRSQSLPRGLC
jgi:hypothetical protein